MKKLLLPQPLIDKIIEKYGYPEGDDFFETLGKDIVSFYDDNKAGMFSYMGKPDDPGNSKDNLKKSIGYNHELKKLDTVIATGTNKFIRHVLSKMFYDGKSWGDMIKDLEIAEEQLIPAKKGKTIKLKNRSQLLVRENLGYENCDGLSGYWLSKFEYISKGIGNEHVGFQYDIEKLNVVDEAHLDGHNLLGVSPSGKVYYHKLNVQVVGDYLIGTWANFKGTKNVGTFQLFIHTNTCVMTGLHLGNANDHSIQSGKWVWLKIDLGNPDFNDEMVNSMLMKDIVYLEANFGTWIAKGSSVRVHELLIAPEV